MMMLKRFENILAIKSNQTTIAFHAHNLDVATLDDEAWQALTASGRQIEAPTESTTESTTDLREAQAELKAWNEEVDSTTRQAELSQKVTSLAINVAQVCNLKCTYCAAGGDGTFGDAIKQVELTTIEEQIKSLMHGLEAGATFRLTFLGGEPLLAPEMIRALARYARLQAAGRGITVRFDIVTNGTLINVEIAELLASLSAHVTVSIDGPPEVNDRNRPTKSGRGATARVLVGLQNLMAVRSRLGALSAGAVFGKHGTDVVDTYRYLSHFELDAIRIDFAAEANDAEFSDAYALSVCEVGELAFANGGEGELRKLNVFDQYFRILDQKVRVRNHCGAGKSHLHADARGAITPCQWFSGEEAEMVGRGGDLDFTKLANFADPLVEKHGCGTCWARNLCGGGCMYVNKTKTGSKHQKDEEFCKRTRTIIAKGIELYARARSAKQEEPCEAH